ncbi:RpiB/LacA/LacB family sugar-phosphate isomerase [Chlamydiia bacterium]|nr:RpiB/LacA/LacB family sugar-phosphate isomerase [Chlamydiia bacterium]
MPTIHIGSDHRGRDLVIEIQQQLNDLYNIVLHIPDVQVTSCDYPEITNKVCEAMEENDWGILICGTGIGMDVAANKHKKNIIAARCTTLDEVKLSREHNNARILCLGAYSLKKQNITTKIICEWIKSFIQTQTSMLIRHQRRRKRVNRYRS